MGWALAAIGAAVSCVFMVAAGVSLLDLLLLACATALLQVLPGWLLARPLLGDSSIGVRLGIAFVTGLPVVLLAWLLAVTTGVRPLVWAVPLVAAGAAYVVGRRRPRATAHLPAHLPARMPIGSAIACTLAWCAICLSGYTSLWRLTSLDLGKGLPHGWYQDVFWHASLTAEATHRVPTVDPQVSGFSFSYHWFANAYEAWQSLATGVSPIPLTAVAGLVPALAATLLLTYGFGAYLGRSNAAGAIAALFFGLSPLVTSKYASLSVANPFMMDSPSHIFSLPVALLLVWLIVRILRGDIRPGHRAATWTLAVVLIALSPGTKVSILPVVVAGLLLVLAVRLWQRREWAEPTLLIGVSLFVLAATYAVFAGGGGGSKLTLLASVRQTAEWATLSGTSHGIRAALLLLAMTVVVLSTLAVPAVYPFATNRQDPAAWFLGGTVLSAIGIVLVLGHPSSSQTYFTRGIVPVMCAMAGAGIARALGADASPRRLVIDRSVLPLAGCALVCGAILAWAGVKAPAWGPATTLLAGAAVCVFVLAVAFVLWTRRRRMPSARAAVAVATAIIALVSPLTMASSQAISLLRAPDYGSEGGTPLSAAETDGAAYLREHSGPTDIVATNVHCLTPPSAVDCDSRSFWVGGLSGRQVFIGGWGYSGPARALEGGGGRSYLEQPYPGDQADWVLNQGIFAEPSRTQADLLWHKGVRYLFADSRWSPIASGMTSVATQVYRRGSVTIYRLHAPS